MKPLDQIGPQTLREEILAVLMAAQGPMLRDAIASRCQLAKSELAFSMVFGELIESRQVVSELAGGRTVFRLPKTGDFALPPEAAKAPSPRLGLAAYRKKVGTTRERVLSLVKERPIGRADVAKALSISNGLAAHHLRRLTKSGELIINPGLFLYASPDQADALAKKAEETVGESGATALSAPAETKVAAATSPAGDGGVQADKTVQAATKPLEIGLVHGDIVIPPDARYGIYSDGEFYIESDDVCVRFPKSSTKAMCEFLDRVLTVTTMA